MTTMHAPPSTIDAPVRWWDDELESEIVQPDELRSDPQLQRVADGALLLLRRGRKRQTPTASSGSGVRLVQRALLALGHPLPRFGADGDFGTETDHALRAFQRSRGSLDVDGMVGPRTLTALVDAVAPPPAPPSTNPVADRWRRTLRIGLTGNTVEALVDGPATFAAIRRAMDSAVNDQHYIYLLGWWCDPWVNLDGPGTCLLDIFGRAGAAGVQVRGLLWASSSLVYPNHAKLAVAAVAAVNRLPNCHLQVDDPPGATKSHHQKMVVVRGTDGLVALQGGVDVNADRVHTLPPPVHAYRSDRPALGWEGGSGGSGSGGPGGVGTPLHDVHALLSGPTALPLMRAFLRRWWSRSGSRAIDATAPLRGDWFDPLPSPTGAQFVRIGETFNATVDVPSHGRVHSRQVAAQDIWLRSLLAARRFIYLEEQYLTLPCAADAINRVLPRIDHVTILVPPSEITDLPGRWRARRDFIARTSAGPHGSKVRVYTPVSAPDTCRRTSGRHLYVHAKIGVIDDELAIIGSANCNHRGWETDSELVIATVDEQDSDMSMPRRLRMRLWQEHLGVPTAAIVDAVSAKTLWDSAPSRRVCRYDPMASSDPISDLAKIPFADPEDTQPGDPCRTLL
jgi:phosphatidylserine/phosphatidylglycerophosphate/cardiolipin synthase-like enzyme